MSVVNITKVAQFKGHQDAIYAMDIDSSCGVIYSAGADGKLVKWNWPSDSDGIQIAQLPGTAYSLKIVENGKIYLGTSTGIDIEHINERIHRISDRFMNQKEKDSTPDKDDTLYKYLIWCAKEAVYKLYGRKAVDFSTHMNVLPFSISKTGKLTLEFTKKNLLRFEVNYMILEDHALAWVEA